MDAAHSKAWKGFLQRFCVLHGGFQRKVALLVFLHHRAYHKYLPPFVYKLFNEAVQPLTIAFIHGEGVHLLPARRQLVDDGDVQVAVDDEGERPGDGGGGHDEDVGRFALLRQRAALVHAEAVLLIRDHQRQIGKRHVLRQKRVGAHDQIDLSGGKGCLDLPLFLRRHGAGQFFHPQVVRSEKAPERGKMLLRQDLRRRHECRLLPGAADSPDAGCRHHGLAAAHVALHKAVHGLSGCHVGERLIHRPLLRAGGFEGQRGVKVIYFG